MQIKHISFNEWAGLIESHFESSIFESPIYFKPFGSKNTKLFLAGGFVNDKLEFILVGSLYHKFHLKSILNIPTFSFGTAPLIKDKEKVINIKAFVEKMDDFIKKKKIMEVIGYTNNEIIAKELRNHGYKVEENTIAFMDLTKDIDTLFAALNQKARGTIRKSIKSGVEVRKENSESILPELYDILKDNAESRGYSIPEKDDFIKRISYYMKVEICDLWTARKNEDILSYLVVFHKKADACAMYQASTGLARQLNPNRLLHWNLLDYYKKLGCRKYWFGFIKSYEPFGKEITGYGKFKLSFRPELIPHFKYTKIYNKKIYLLCRLLEKVIK